MSFRGFRNGQKQDPSMKVPPKRKGNFIVSISPSSQWSALNESPSEKEGK